MTMRRLRPSMRAWMMTALAHDNAFQIVIVVAGIANPLLDQSTRRLRLDLRLDDPDRPRCWIQFQNPSADDATVPTIRDVLDNWRDPDTPEEYKKTILITVLSPRHARRADLRGAAREPEPDDTAGAGKTIMAGLLVRELKLRGLIERVLVVCPANLSFQWQRELKEKFDEKFLVLKGSDIRDQFGVNQWMEQKRIITSLDLAKRTEILPGLRQVHWDLVIVDEAHRMSARDETHKSQRYRLGGAAARQRRSRAFTPSVDAVAHP